MYKKTVIRRHYKYLIGLGLARTNKVLEAAIDVEYTSMSDEEAPKNNENTEQDLKEFLAIDESKIEYIDNKPESKSSFTFQSPAQPVEQAQKQQKESSNNKTLNVQKPEIVKPVENLKENPKQQEDFLSDFGINAEVKKNENNTPIQEDASKNKGLNKKDSVIDFGVDFKSAIDVKKEQEKIATENIPSNEEKSLEQELGFDLNFDLPIEKEEEVDEFLKEMNTPPKLRFE